MVTYSHELLCLTAVPLIDFGGSLCYVILRTAYELDSSIIPVVEMRRLRFRAPTSAAKDRTPMEWKSWHSDPRPRTSKAVSFLPGYPALDRIIICYLQTPSIIELKKELGITVERNALLPSVLLVSPFPASYPSFSLPPYGLFYTLSFYLRNTAKPQFPVFCLIIQGRK